MEYPASFYYSGEVLTAAVAAAQRRAFRTLAENQPVKDKNRNGVSGKDDN